jgi:H+-transporting ATPase
MELLGLLLLSDVLRPDAQQVINFLKESGVDVKLMTGDNRAIASRVAQTLGLRGKVLAAAGKTQNLSVEKIAGTSVFAEVLPDDKFRIVKAASKHWVAAATGDGVNDLPALKQANVGIAVNSAVDALKSAADIVLLTSGIAVIRTAVVEARRIFSRTYYYSIYRISESFRLILTIAILSIVNGTFPMTAVQIILLAILNDLPIITLAYDRVAAVTAPSAIHAKQRFGLASLYGLVGVVESIGLFYVMRDGLHLSTAVIQTMFFLKLTVSGHLLIYVAHTRQRWWRWLPAKQIIWATSLTQLAATVIALSGLFFQGIVLWQAGLVWLWALAWMQVNELVKYCLQRWELV